MSKRTKTVKAIFIAAVIAASLPVSAQTILTMERALDIAEQNSPTMKTSYMSMQRQQELLDAQKASLKSQFRLTLNPVTYSQSRQVDSYTSNWYTNKTFNTQGTFRVDQPILFTDGTLSLTNTFGWQNSESSRQNSTTTSKRFSNNLNVSLTQPLFTYNTQKMELRELELDYENSIINYALQRMSTEQSITSQFYSVFSAQERLKIAEVELENAKQNFELIKNRVEIDLQPRSELYQAEVTFANSQSSYESQIVTLENAKDRLKQTLGLPMDEDIVVTIGEIQFSQIDIDIDKAVAHAFRTRLELRQREITTENLYNQLIRTKAQNEFSGSLSLSMGLSGDDEKFTDIYSQPTQSPRIALSLNVPIFDWGAKKARVKAQEISIDINSINAEEELRTMEVNIRQTIRNLENLVNQVSIMDQSQRNAQLTYDLNTVMYREGEITGMEMSQYETQLSSAKINYISAIIDYRTELLNLKIMTLWDFENNVTAVPDLAAIRTSVDALTSKNKRKNR